MNSTIKKIINLLLVSSFLLVISSAIDADPVWPTSAAIDADPVWPTLC